MLYRHGQLECESFDVMILSTHGTNTTIKQTMEATHLINRTSTESVNGVIVVQHTVHRMGKIQFLCYIGLLKGKGK